MLGQAGMLGAAAHTAIEDDPDPPSPPDEPDDVIVIDIGGGEAGVMWSNGSQTAYIQIGFVLIGGESEEPDAEEIVDTLSPQTTLYETGETIPCRYWVRHIEDQLTSDWVLGIVDPDYALCLG